eukprot:scaffold296149_cov21-Prasinocladus_malaysianus.AAC.1
MHACEAHIRSPHLQKVLVAPGVGEFGRLPGLVDRKECQVVALRGKELGLLGICCRLLLPRPGKPQVT